MDIEQYKNLIKLELLPFVSLKSENPFDPIKVTNHSKTWNTVGNGNYAAVFEHPSFPESVVKIYGRHEDQLKKEIEVYGKLGNHPAYSVLLGYDENYLILKKIEGCTLFEAILKGILIPESVMNDIDQAIAYSKRQGLNPYDVHGKNIVMKNGKGYIVDVSDFYKKGYCRKWNDLRKAYHMIYKPFMYRSHPPIPFLVMELIRKSYGFISRLRKRCRG